LWDEYLESASSDRDLLVLAGLAQAGSAGPWLEGRLAAGLTSDNPFRKTRAVLLRGFLDSAEAPQEPSAAPTDAIDWQREQHERALEYWRYNRWAKTWFQRFVSEGPESDALGAFRLFLRCVDGRYQLWRRSAMIGITDHRLRFLASCDDQIERAIRKNEEDLRKQFLGMRVAERQVWPWC
jgi:hypothetical protein